MFKKINFLEKLKLYVYVIKLNFKKQKRTYHIINEEYDKGIWNRQINDLEIKNLDGNYGKTGQTGIFAINDVLTKISYEEFHKNREKEFLLVFKNFEKEKIIELGCGLGGNIFSLYNAGFKNLSGCDLSSNAILKLKNYTEKNDFNINFFIHDLNNPFNLELKDKIVFTHTVLEQTKNIMENVLINIINGCPKLVINFEVDYNEESFLVRKYFDSRDYQNNLVTELKKLEKQNKISIISIDKMKFRGSPVNRHSIIIWKPN